MRGGPSLRAMEIVAFLLIFVSLATNYIAYFVPLLAVLLTKYRVPVPLCPLVYYSIVNLQQLRVYRA